MTIPQDLRRAINTVAFFTGTPSSDYGKIIDEITSYKSTNKGLTQQIEHALSKKHSFVTVHDTGEFFEKLERQITF